MKTFITEDFLLQSGVAKELYHAHAEPEPIFDYHCHLPPEQIAADKRFRNLYEIWLAEDHYKWRAMRTNGVEERFCTGDAPDREKFMAWARTTPRTLRNPLYHWSHLELLRYFGIDELLDETSAAGIWDKANERLAAPEMSVHGLLESSRVRVVCTTDDPADTLEYHRQIQGSALKTRVYPTFRPDKAMAVDQPGVFKAWVGRLEAVSGKSCGTLASFLEALDARHAFFHSMGGRLSDHDLETCLAEDCTPAEAAAIYDRSLSGRAAGRGDWAKFGSFLMLYFGELDAKRGWTKQLHLGAMRNNNVRLFKGIGANVGCDSIGDFPQARALSRYLGALDERGSLPKTVLYNLNPADNYVFGTMIGNFQDNSLAGKIQFGSGWWFLDQKEAMIWQLNALSNLGLLGRFVGMLTDSRSFLSYTRHEYFRRILCNLIGGDVERGELPGDMDLLGSLVSGICYGNARDYFGLGVGG